MQWLRRLFAHYAGFHAYGPPRLKYMGWLGVATSLSFYFLRFTRNNPALWDDLPLRLIAGVLFLGMALRDQWPARLKPNYIAYSYLVLLYCLPTFNVLLALERGGGLPAISNLFIMLSFLVMVTDWRNTLVMVGGGVALASAYYALTNPQPQLPADVVAQLPAYALIIVGGSLFKFSTEQIEAERKLRHTQALAGSIAHELRHPLAQVRRSLEEIERLLPAPAATGQLAPLQVPQLEALYGHVAQGEQAIERGLQVVSMTLDEVSARPLDSSSFSWLSAAEVVQKAVDDYSYPTEAARAQVEVVVRRDFPFLGEETAYLFVLFNLLKNALYYIGPYPGMHVTVTVDEREVRVRDNGPGIAPHQLATLFEPFRSVGKVGGTGLGLAYCQRVMQAFGGSIQCDSALGRFTEFTMRFPVASPETQQAWHDQLFANARGRLQGRRLLLVEDDPMQRASTRRQLAPLGMRVDEASDGQQAMDLLVRQPYDLVLLDLHMPVLDGFQLALQVRRGSAPANREARLVAYTSEHTHLARVKALRAGVDGFLHKPCSQAALVRGLQRALDRPSAAAPAPVQVLAGRRILLADDSAFNRRTVTALLQEAGASVGQAEHGLSVLELLDESGPFDAVVMDLHMPGLDGLEAARAIRSSARPWAAVPIVALTANSDAGSMDAARAAGMNAFLSKPVEADQLYATLETLLDAPGAAIAPVAPAVPAPAPAPGPTLLNTGRLESFQTLGLLDELVSDYLPQITRLVGTLAEQVSSQQLAQAQETLHSLLGMSGEAGALALYQAVRRVYIPVLEQGRWPADGGWLAQVQVIARDTELALREWTGRQPASGGA